MDAGKLPPDALRALLKYAKKGRGVIVGAEYGEDSAAFEFEKEVVVAASDPITFVTDRIGYYSVCVNINDIAVMGAVPRYYLATILLPTGSDKNLAVEITRDICEVCDRYKISLVGGHTEATPAVVQPVVVGCMLGETDKDTLVASSGAKVGDSILLAGLACIEGTAILAGSAGGLLAENGISEDVLGRAAALVDTHGICIYDYARYAVSTGGVHAMHDPTEGGIGSALRELATSSGVGLAIDPGSIQYAPGCAEMCEALGLDPLGLISSGCLLIVCDTDKTDDIVTALGKNGVPASCLGSVKEAEYGIRYVTGEEIPVFSRDEIARFFEENDL